ncbi:MAG TPA: flippase activity-associated protein Agl23 [Anaerolineae bacterium]|nr:flippase activity-associated protein Agl23 [Anaerolineae bacterium]
MEAFDVTVQVAEQEQESISWMTVERVAYLAIGLLAAALRFFQLGLRPLGEAEAVQSLAAFRFTQDMTQSATAGTIPALFTGDVIGFTLMGASDATARWLPALAGVIMALLPYGLRRRLGRGGALAASVLLALSPSAAFFSRSLDSAILVAACGLAMTVGLINYLDTHRQGHLYFLAAALGLGLTAGRGTYTLLLIWVAFAMVLYLGERFGGREEGWSSLLVGWSTLRSEQGLLAKTGAVLAATFGLVTMTFVLHPAGVGHAADLVGDWAKGFLPEPDGQPFIYPVLLLFRYELLILFLGFVEIGRWLVRGRSEGRGDVQFGPLFPHTAFLVFWAAVGLLIILIAGHRSAGDILLVVVPLALLAGQGMQRAWCWISQRGLWFEAGVFALVAMGVTTFFYLQMAAFGASSPTATDSLAGINLYASLTYLIFGVLAVLLLVGLGAVSWVLRGPQLVLAGGWLAAVIILGLLGFSAMWGASFDHASDARELMIMETTVPDVRLFGEQLEALSLDRAGDAHSLPITVDAATGPVVAWYLRDFQQQSVVEGLSSAPETVAAVTLAAQDLPIGETFRGQGFPLRTHWLPWGLWGQDLIRWLLFNEGSLPVVDQEVVLWVLSEP